MPRLLIGPLLRYVGPVDATIWVETDEPCEVTVLGTREHTWEVSGHHYALLTITGLEPGTATEYDVRLDDAQVWPLPDDVRPPARIRTPTADGRVRLAFGSCRYGRAAVKLADPKFDPDALAAYARGVMAEPETRWPDAVLMLGDQVYADETSEQTQRRIRAKRDLETPPGIEVADFEEYTWLYLESWTDPDVRWLLATVPSAMIFDDHDVRDDWNTSHEWRADMKRTPWWHERIVGGLSSYWVYQHLGNLSPADLADNELFRKVRTAGGDVAPMLREFAEHADAEADGAKGTQWSFRRDFGRVRLVMVDSRCGRILADGHRSMLSKAEFSWVREQTADTADVDHLLIGTSLPWLLPRALHDVEAWDEVLANGTRGRLLARFGEWLRRAADLEHWAAFRESFDELGDVIASVAGRDDAPASICVLSGDVHHAYVAEASFDRPTTSRVYQLTCSPLHNHVPPAMRLAFRLFWSRIAERFVRVLLGIVATVPTPTFRWQRRTGPFFSNEIAEFVADGRRADTTLHQPASSDPDTTLDEVSRLRLAG